MRPFLFILLITLACCFHSMAQSVPPRDPQGNMRNMEKYWWYRYRLVNDFMKIGTQCGESIPAQRRNRAVPYYSSVDFGKMGFSDATIDLGNYITALATEHRQLANNGLSTARTDMELYYALEAFDRLDKKAEAYCDNIDATYPCMTGDREDLNGFFVRDDVPFTQFIQNNLTHFNRKGIKNLIPVNDINTSGFKGRYSDPVYGVDGGWSSSKKRVPSEESQDQIVQLSMGMALAANEPGGIYYAGTNLSTKAGNALFRMVNYVDAGSKIPLTWQIVNPITNQCVYGTDPAHGCSDAGADFFYIARGAAQSTQKYSFGYASSASMLVFKTAHLNPLWQLQQFNKGHDDLGFWGTLAALSDSWYIGVKIPFVGVVGKNTTYDKMKAFGKAHDWGNQHLPLLYRALHYEGGIYRPFEYQQLFDAAPSCGIHNYNGSWNNWINWYTGAFEHNPPNSHHWSGNDAIHEWYHRNKTYDNSDCNGLDYMALFNLYTMEDPGYLKYMFNPYYKENFNQDYPYTSSVAGVIGSTAHKLKLNFLEYLSAINKVNSDGNLTFRGAKVIDLKPGFDAKYSSNFLAYIEDYQITCGQDPGNGNPGTPSEAYHYAELTNIVATGGGVLPQNNTNTVYLDFPPDGVSFIPDSSAYAVDPVDSIEITCAMEHAYFDSLVAEIYASGDQAQIDYMENSIIPNAYFPACDSLDGDSSSSSNPGNFRIAGTNQQKGTDGNYSFNVYPSPNNGNFTVVFNTAGEYDISLLNALGQEVFRTHVYSRQSEIVHAGDLPAGIYTITATNSSGTPNRQVRKLIITH